MTFSMRAEQHTIQTPESEVENGISPERQRLAKEYAAIRRRLYFVELGIMAAGVLLLLVTGWSAVLRDWAESISSNPFMVVALYGIALGVIYTLVSLPLGYYSGFVLPHRYGLS